MAVRGAGLRDRLLDDERSAEISNLELVRWLRDAGCPWGWTTCRDAVLCSQPEVLRSARTAARGTPTPGTWRLGRSGTRTTSATWSTITASLCLSSNNSVRPAFRIGHSVATPPSLPLTRRTRDRVSDRAESPPSKGGAAPSGSSSLPARPPRLLLLHTHHHLRQMAGQLRRLTGPRPAARARRLLLPAAPGPAGRGPAAAGPDATAPRRRRATRPS